MRNAIKILLLLPLFVFGQGIKVKDLPTTTTGTTGDFIIKDDAAGVSGSTKKISIANFKTAYGLHTGTVNADFIPIATSTNTFGNSPIKKYGSYLGLDYTSSLEGTDNGVNILLNLGTSATDKIKIGSTTYNTSTFGYKNFYWSNDGTANTKSAIDLDNTHSSMRWNTLADLSNFGSTSGYIDIIGGQLEIAHGTKVNLLATGNIDIYSLGGTTDVKGQLKYSYAGANPGNGKVLTSDASGNASWATPASGLPTQTGQAYKFLTTDGSSASWSFIHRDNLGNTSFNPDLRRLYSKSGAFASSWDSAGSFLFGQNARFMRGKYISDTDTNKVRFSFGANGDEATITTDGTGYVTSYLGLTPIGGSLLLGNTAGDWGQFTSNSDNVDIYHTKLVTITPIKTEIGVNSTDSIKLTGKLKIITGTPGAGKVLTSDAVGNASWQTGGGGSGTVTSVATGFGLTGGTITTTGTIKIDTTTGNVGGARPATQYWVRTNKLSNFASTTSAELAGVLSDETGSASGGLSVFNNTPTIITPSFTTGFTIGGTAASGKFIVGNGTNYVASTSTIPTSAGATANKVLLSDGTNYVLSTPTFPNSSATAGKIIVSDGTNWTASTPTFPNASATSGKVIISDGTNFVASTTIFPNSGTANRVPYFSSSNTLGESANLQFTGTYASVGGAANTGSLAQALQLFPTNTYYWQGYYNTGLAHGMTGIAPTNCAAFTNVYDSGVNGGGFQFFGLTGSTAGNPALDFNGVSGASTPTAAPVRFRSSKKSGTANTSLASTDPAFSFVNNSTNLVTILGSGNTGFGGTTSPTAQIHLAAGSATASTAPLKLTTGTSNTTAEAGALEYTTPQLFFTNGGGQRQEIPQIQQSRTTSSFNKTNTTLADVTGLTATVVAGKTYRFEAELYLTVDLFGGIRVAIGGTATATSFIGMGQIFDAGDPSVQATTKLTALAGISYITTFSNSGAYAKITGTITVNAAGTLTVQAAQGATNGTSTVLAGSTFVLTEMN